MRRKKRLTIRQKLTMLFIAFVIYPVLVVAIFGYFKYANDIKLELTNSLFERTGRVGAQTVERFGQIKSFAMKIPYDGVLNDIFLKRRDEGMSERDVYTGINNYLYSKFYSKQEIKSVSFCFIDKPNVVYMVDSDNSYNQYIKEIHPRILEESEKLTRQYGYYISGKGDIYVIRQMHDRFSFRQYGIIAIKIDTKYMLKDFTDEFTDHESHLLLCSGGIIMENGVFRDKAALTELIARNQGITGVTSERLDSDEVVIGSINLDNINIQYGIVIPSDKFMGRYYDALKVLVVFTLFSAVALLMMAIPLKKAIWSPIRELVGLMKNLGKGNLGIQSNREVKDEFEFIFESFNDMSSEIKHLFDVVYKEELARKEAQLSALQSRINPHFLYNTLEIMNWKARISGNKELSEMIEALGTLMDAGMNKGGEGICRLSEELKLVDSYMYIMDKRFGKRLEYKRKIDGDIEEALIPKLIIQPLLENAMIHGLEPRGGGTVYLTAKRIDGEIEIEVSDNGVGITDRDLEEYSRLLAGKESRFKGSEGIGIRNVNERIKLLYGNGYGLSLTKGETGGTKAIIHMPYTVREAAPMTGSYAHLSEGAVTK